MPYLMGVMKFLVPRRDLHASDALERAYMAGLDEIPWRARFRWVDDVLVAERVECDSGNLFFPLLVPGRGELLLSTASLMERASPYHLHVELARGTINRLRNQLAAWESFGMRVPGEVRALVAQATQTLAQATTRQDDAADVSQRAAHAISVALDALDALAASYAEQALATRRQVGRINTLWGANLGQSRLTPAVAKALAPASNAAIVPLTWRDIEAREGQHDWSVYDAQIEWCRAHNLKVCSGPLLRIDRWSLPDWMYLWGEDDNESFQKCVAEHIEAVVSRYRGKVHFWQCAARLNMANDFNHSEGDRLRLAVLSVQAIRRVDARTPIVLSLDRPWGSYMGREDYELSPLHFADALVRAQLGIAGLGLEINVGDARHGTEPRDVVEFGRQIDRFCALGLPLLVLLTAPGGEGEDAAARLKGSTLGCGVGGEHGDACSPAAQAGWAERYLPMLFTKQAVQGVFWNQLRDSQPHAFAHGGLFDASDQAKPALEVFARLRREHVV